jgi:dTDP-4-dehydrorhamnose reductase
MKILLFGKNGQLGHELIEKLSKKADVYPLSRDSKDYCGDLFDEAGIADSVAQIKPNIIINAAAYTKVDLAEKEISEAFKVNANAPARLASEAEKINALFVHYSTDYVFDGSGSKPWVEGDKTSPLNIYGKSKLQGELEIINSRCRHFIIRTSWVYSFYGENFVTKIIKLAQEKSTLDIVSDQIGAPTSTSLLADATLIMINKVDSEGKLGGVYHIVPRGSVSWYEFAKFILQTSNDFGFHNKLEANEIHPVLSQVQNQTAKRPLNSRMSALKFEKNFNVVLPSWENDVKLLINKLKLGK